MTPMAIYFLTVCLVFTLGALAPKNLGGKIL
jgi:hypothetical protein